MRATSDDDESERRGRKRTSGDGDDDGRRCTRAKTGFRLQADWSDGSRGAAAAA